MLDVVYNSGIIRTLKVQGSVFTYDQGSTSIISKVGIRLYNLNSFYLEKVQVSGGLGNEFHNLFFGVDQANVGASYIQNNVFENCIGAINSQSTSARFCSNSITDCEYGMIGRTMLTSTYYDNEITMMSDGVHLALGGEQFFRNNMFTDYCSDGIISHAANLILRPVAYDATYWSIYGRNIFGVSPNLNSPYNFCRELLVIFV
jgi:hypothetical protein